MRKFIVAIVGVLVFAFNAQSQRPDLPGHLIIDLGINSWSDIPTGADLNGFQSKTVNLLYYYDFAIGERGWTFTPGFGLGLEKYSFKNANILTSIVDNAGTRTVSVTSLPILYSNATAFDKSKLGLNYLDIPLEFRYYTSGNNYNRGFRVAFGAKFGVLYSSFTKVKLEDALTDKRMVKDRQDLGINKFRYGAQARVGWGGFSLFAYFELSKKFDIAPAGGLDTRTTTIGISLTGF